MALTSLMQAEYEKLLPVFSVYCEEKLSLYTLKGKRRKARKYSERKDSSLYGSTAKLDFVLMYLKANPLQESQALLFEMSQAKVSEWLYFLLPVLERSLSYLKLLPQEGFAYNACQSSGTYFNADVSERLIARNLDSEAQKEEYSGKKKRHTVKNLVICDNKNKVVFMSDLYEGSVHDKTIWDELLVDLQGRNILMDLGFHGTDFTEAILPFKKQKNKPLSAHQKAVNRALSSMRVSVEHVFAAIKRLHIVRYQVRLKAHHIRQQLFRIAIGIHNLRTEFRQENKT